MLTQEKVQELFEYRSNGLLVRKVTVGSRAMAGDIVGTPDVDGYLQVMIEGKTHKVHRIVWLHVNGYLPEYDIDHVNGIVDDNRIENLRHVSRSCNLRNTGNHSFNTSGVKGVSWSKASQKWMGIISVENKNRYLGVYSDFLEAVMARYEAEQRVDGFCDYDSPARQYLIKEGYLERDG